MHFAGHGFAFVVASTSDALKGRRRERNAISDAGRTADPHTTVTPKHRQTNNPQLAAHTFSAERPLTNYRTRCDEGQASTPFETERQKQCTQRDSRTFRCLANAGQQLSCGSQKATTTVSDASNGRQASTIRRLWFEDLTRRTEPRQRRWQGPPTRRTTEAHELCFANGGVAQAGEMPAGKLGFPSLTLRERSGSGPRAEGSEAGRRSHVTDEQGG